MQELELVRSAGDRRLYELGGVGTLRLADRLRRTTVARAGEREWTFSVRGLLRAAITATDATGAVAGSFAGRRSKGGGTLSWAGRDLLVRPDSFWKERYALVEGDGETELASIEGAGWGKRPVQLGVADLPALDPGLLLFATFVVRTLAEDRLAIVAGGS